MDNFEVRDEVLLCGDRLRARREKERCARRHTRMDHRSIIRLDELPWKCCETGLRRDDTERRVLARVTIMLSSLIAGDEVAILPAADSPPQHTLEIVKVAFVNVHLVRLVDHRVYSLSERRGLTPISGGFLAPATDAHRNALAAMRARRGDSIDGVSDSCFRA
jgi:hypothetical protein